MNKRMNLAALALLAGVVIGFAPVVVKVMVLVIAGGLLLNAWDDYELMGGASHE